MEPGGDCGKNVAEGEAEEQEDPSGHLGDD